MKKSKVKYTNEPIGKMKIVNDFLPPPKDLVLKDSEKPKTLDKPRWFK